MKKIITTLLITNSIIAYSQFKITPANFVNEADLSKNYVVIESPDKSKSDLFNVVKMYVNSNYKGVKFDGYNEVVNEQIVIDLVYRKPNAGALEWGGGLLVKDRIEINFKDGKVMIKPIFYKMVSPDGRKEIYLTGGSGFVGKSVFNQKGEVWIGDKLVETINNSVNVLTNDIKNKIINSTSNDW
ncbi:TPA: hypothetical protein NEG48_001548 [Elizabethkingia anophelis]|nr:hypothetical protein [Elizabethkingia anophelis]